MKDLKENKKTKSITKKMIFSFVVPFTLVLCCWTIIDYIDISDGLEMGRGGNNPAISEQQILLDSFKQSFIFAIPAGLIGLAAGFACFRNKDSSK